jgi:hypothetical protein
MLGNCKPASLLQVELSFWRKIVSVATGEKSAFCAVKEFLLEEVNWEDLEKISASDKEFYKPGRCS